MKRLLSMAAMFLCCVATSFAQFSGSGSGTEADPYLIFNPIQLNQLRNFLNQSGVYFKLMSDVDLKEFLEDENPSQGWQPVGSESSPFKGVLDGNGKSIKNLWIKRSSTDYVGLFGYTSSAIVKNLTVEVNIQGGSYTGGLSGYSSGSTFSDCHLSGSVSGTTLVGGFIGNSNAVTLSSNTSTADVTGTGWYVGGYIGRADGTGSLNNCTLHCNKVVGTDYVGGVCGANIGENNDMSNCYIHTAISGNNYIGGICGKIENSYPANLSNSCFIGDIVGGSYMGGLVGSIHKGSSNINQVRNCFAVGDIKGENYIGGLIGSDNGSYLYFKNSGDHYYYYCISNCYYSGKISGTEYVAGLVGYKKYGELSRCYANANVVGTQYVGGVCGSMERVTIKQNVAICTKVSGSVGDVGRIFGIRNGGTIGTPGTQDENKAWNRTVVMKAGVAKEIEDGEQHGTGVSATTLKLKATYVAMGFDFNDTWAIQETECYPYFKWQMAPPVITSKVVSQATTISGKSIDGGTVCLDIDGKETQQTTASGNNWSFTVSPLQAGQEVRAYTKADDKEQSYYATETVSFLGSGTADDPYQVYTPADLSMVFLKGYYKQMNDIDLTNWISQNSPTEGWLSVGREGCQMSQYDGNGYKVTGLWSNTTRDNTGLFAVLANATIKNLTVETAKDKQVKGGANTGILIGKLIDGEITNCKVSGSLSDGTPVGGVVGMLEGGKVSLCQANTTISTTGASTYVGGIAGESTGEIDQCVTLGSIKATGNSTYAAGIAGTNSGTVSNSYSNIAITSAYCAAGIVGYNYGAVDKCYAYGNLSSMNYAAGVVGYNDGTNATVAHCAAMNYKLDVTYESQSAQSGGYGQRILGGMKNNAPSPEMNNYALSTMQVSVNGVAQKVYDDLMNGVAKTQADLKVASTYQAIGWDFDTVWSITSGEAYPYLKQLGVISENPATLYTLTYMVDGERYKRYELAAGEAITPEPAPTKEGYTFSGWSEIPATMPEHNVTVTGSFTIGKDASDTDVSQYDNVLFFEKEIAASGNTATFSLKMNNKKEITGFQCDIYLPNGMTFEQDEDGFYLTELSTERTTAKKTNIFNTVIQSDGALRILASSTSSATFSGTSGEVATVTVSVSKDMADGDYPLVVKGIELSDNSGTSYSVEYVKSTVTVKSFTLGDVNSDLKVNVADITAIANHILGLPTATFIKGAADLNNDTKVNVADITCLANLILYGDIHGAASARARTSSIGMAVASLPSMSIHQGETIQIPVHISGDVDFSAFQFDIILPEGISLVRATLGDRQTSSMQQFFNYAKQTDGSYRVLGANIDGRNFMGNDGEIVMLTLQADADAVTGNVAIEQIILAKNGVSSQPAATTSLLTVEGATSIDSIFSEDGTATICTLQGIVIMTNATKDELSKLQKGVYIVNGKKISIK